MGYAGLKRSGSQAGASVRRRVAVVTGTRAEYGALQSVLSAIAAEPRLELQLVVTGMHLLARFGATIRQIQQDARAAQGRWKIDACIRMQRGSDEPLDQAEGLARGVAGIARFLHRARTDIVLVLGDRIEAMAASLAAVTTGRVLAHIHGGDLAPGDFDQSLRRAITRLAHVHFAATRRSAQRIVRSGEKPRYVYVVGAPGLDRLRELIRSCGPRQKRSHEALVVYHPTGRPARREQRVMTDILQAVRAAGLRRVIIYPNTDRGHRGILRAIELHRRSSPADEVEIFASLARDEYLRRLLRADVLVGNSSSGIIEAPVAGTPSVNIGDRQAGREPGGPSIIHAGESPQAILRAIRRAMALRPRRGGPSVYGDGRAGKRIARILAKLPLERVLRDKRLLC
jgi:GDP/UDP-N,N'-diacetylbacillosamine 2-epimerase (hydrolysing)